MMTLLMQRAFRFIRWHFRRVSILTMLLESELILMADAQFIQERHVELSE